jgi:hypothetical protein
MISGFEINVEKYELSEKSRKMSLAFLKLYSFEKKLSIIGQPIHNPTNQKQAKFPQKSTISETPNF